MIVKSKEEQVEGVKAMSSLGCSNHDIVEFKSVRNARGKDPDHNPELEKSRDFGLSRDLLGKIP